MAHGMKRKIGPLPLWAWVLIAGGTIGLVLYMRGKSTSAATAAGSPNPTASPVLDATAGAPPDANGGGGGSPAIDPTGSSGASIDDVYNALLGIEGSISALPGGQGLTDAATGQDGSPVKTFAGEVNDVTAGINALGKLGNIFNSAGDVIQTPGKPPKKTKRTAAQMRADNPAMVQRVKDRNKKKKTNGSGGLGALAVVHPKTPPRRTSQQVASTKTQNRAAVHEPAKAVHVSSGGNKQPQRTAKPKKKKKT